MNFYERIRAMFWKKLVELCNQHQTTPTTVVHELKIGTGCVTKWRNGSIPRDTTLKKIADYFQVSPDYFTDKTKKDPGSKNRGLEESSDVAEKMNHFMQFLEQQEALMFDGEPMDEESLELVRASLRNAYAIAMAKKPVTRKKYKMKKG